jgi:hypothetical protein
MSSQGRPRVIAPAVPSAGALPLLMMKRFSWQRSRCSAATAASGRSARSNARTFRRCYAPSRPAFGASYGGWVVKVAGLSYPGPMSGAGRGFGCGWRGDPGVGGFRDGRQPHMRGLGTQEGP